MGGSCESGPQSPSFFFFFFFFWGGGANVTFMCIFIFALDPPSSYNKDFLLECVTVKETFMQFLYCYIYNKLISI